MTDQRNISDDMIFVGYYLSRLSDHVTGSPPIGLGASSWDEVLEMFANALSEGRSPNEYRKTLKALQAGFDENFEPTQKIVQIDSETGTLSMRRAVIRETYQNWSEDQLDRRAYQIAARSPAMA